MKTHSLTALALVSAVVALAPCSLSAQAGPPPSAKEKPMMDMGADHMMSGWKELDAFHMLMASTWHPVEKSKDLSVIRQKATALAESAETWSKSRAPAACDTKAIRDAIAAVVSQSKAVAELVARQAADAEVTTALRDVHTKFEVVESGCHASHHKM